MSPETSKAIAEGKSLSKKQYVEYIDHVARDVGIKGGSTEAIERAKSGTPSMNPGEERVRILIATAALDVD